MGLRFALLLCLACAELVASTYRGQVVFGNLPVSGATITALQSGKQIVTVTDQQGMYSFPDLADGLWTIKITMTGFSPVQDEVQIRPSTPAVRWDLQMLPIDRISAHSVPPPTIGQSASQSTAKERNENERHADSDLEDLMQTAAPSLLVNGSINNAADSPFAQAAAFGNNRTRGNALYTGGIGVIIGNSAVDAKPFSLTGQNIVKPTYQNVTGLLSFGGPLRIPHLLRNGPNVFINYQWTRNSNAVTDYALMPDSAARAGFFFTPIIDPTTGLPFPGNRLPPNHISPQAQALLTFYPLPNFPNNAGYNYQIPVVSAAHQDALQSRFNKTLNNRNQVNGRFDFQSFRQNAPNVFGFVDTTDTLGINAQANWSHRFDRSFFLNLGYQFSYFSTHVVPYFENRGNVSGYAGISGNDQAPTYWGPPSLTFSGGTAGLTDALPAFNRNRTGSLSYSLLWNHGSHNITVGGDFRRLEFNYLTQQDPRGTFTFTGASTGSDFADFLLGIPNTASIAFGNADKYLRGSIYDAYLADDWRIAPGLTLNVGIRWEYGSPLSELYNRLVNLDIAPGFTAVAPVVASDPLGPLTGDRYPDSLLHPDKHDFEPRIGLAWRPLSGSSFVLRAGYGVYYNTSVYQSITSQLAQQPPLSKTLNIQNNSVHPLTLADGLNASPGTTANTFAIDPDFRIGYAQTWNLSIQKDLPGALQLTASYLGVKGTRGVQEFLPNTFPIGSPNPCPVCPSGYVYVTSNGNSTREAAQIQLRRRLHSGLAAVVQYTFSKSIDDDAALGGQAAYLPSAATQNPSVRTSSSTALSSGGGNSASTGQSGAASNNTSAPSALIAQNWLNLSAERSLSAFDQRQLVSLVIQYTTGMGIGGGTLLSGWKGALLKDWTFASQITAGSGLPETPIFLAAVPGTGFTGTIRPDYTGAPLYSAPAGLFLNPAAFTAPLSGYWGNAGRDSITGPAQFSLDASLGRTFRLRDRLNLDLRLDSTNALNHVTFTSWNTTINNTQFGLPIGANAMRSVQLTARLRF